MCLLNGHQIKDHHAVQLFVNFENYRIRPPDMHTIYLHFGMQTFYIGCAVRIFKFAEVVEDMFPDLLRILFECPDDTSFDLNIHVYTPATLPVHLPLFTTRANFRQAVFFSLIWGC